MRRDVHACSGARLRAGLKALKALKAIVVGKTPCADQRALSLRQCALHPDCPRSPQRNLARMQHLDAGGLRRTAGHFGRRSFKVAHHRFFVFASILRHGVMRRRYRQYRGASTADPNAFVMISRSISPAPLKALHSWVSRPQLHRAGSAGRQAADRGPICAIGRCNTTAGTGMVSCSRRASSAAFSGSCRELISPAAIRPRTS